MSNFEIPPLVRMVLYSVLASTGVLAALLRVLGHVPVATMMQRGVGGLLLLPGLFQLVNSYCRRRVEHWKARDLRRLLIFEFVIGCLAPLAAAAVCLFLPTNAWLLVGLTVGGVLLGAYYEQLELTIYDTVERLGLEHGTALFGRLRPFAFFGGDDLRRASERSAGWQPLHLLSILFARSPLAPLSATRWIIACILTLASVFSLIGAAAAWIEPPTHESHSHHRGPTTVPRAGHQASSGSRQSSSPGRPPAKPSASASCPTLPGARAPVWAREAIYHAFLGGGKDTGPAPGTAEAGCTGQFFTSSGPSGRFTYGVGVDPQTGDVRSVVVDSDVFGPAIFLTPAVKPVLGLIHDYHVIGGLRRRDIGRGDAYLVETPAGTVVLIRATKNPAPGSALAQPYTMLLPAAAAAWMDALRRFGSWLWPFARLGVNGAQSISLVVSPISKNVKETILYDLGTGSAQGEAVSYGPLEPPLNPKLVDYYAATAE